MDLFDDLDGNVVSHAALIAASDTVRDIGHDTLNAAMGKLTEGSKQPDQSFRMKLCPRDAHGIVDSLYKMAVACRTSGKPEVVCQNVLSLRVAYHMVVTIQSATDVNFDDLGNSFTKRKSIKFNNEIAHKNGRITQMHTSSSKPRW
ncbi:MAG: hypothetical protein ACI9XZ_003641 [Alphaproteobacteria bacterium]|jgi:hypothetical protein